MYPNNNQQQMQYNPQMMQQQQPQMYANQMMQQPVQTTQMQSGKYKTQLCRHFKNGNCQLGASCYFAHGVHELRTMTDPLPQGIPAQGPAKAGASNFKTVQCKYFQQGFCKNAASCSFAHGVTDIGNASNVMGQTAQPQTQQQDPNVQILIMILQNLEQVFPGNQAIIDQLKQAQVCAQNNQSNEATQAILKIMESPDRTEVEKQQYQTIYSNAQQYYTQYMLKQQQQ